MFPKNNTQKKENVAQSNVWPTAVKCKQRCPPRVALCDNGFLRSPRHIVPMQTNWRHMLERWTSL